MFSILYPQLQTIDFRQTIKQIEVPVYFLDGTAELRGRRNLALEWFEALARIMVEVILPKTYLQP